MNARSKFAVAVQDEIVRLVMEGAFMRDAAEIAGISRNTLRNWLHPKNTQYRRFQYDVRRARAMARFNAGAELYKKDPKAWLTRGPGRERFGGDGMLLEGWSNGAPRPPVTPELPDITTTPEFKALLDVLEQMFAEMPDLRKRISDALGNVKVPEEPEEVSIW